MARDDWGPIKSGAINRANDKARVIDLGVYRNNRDLGFSKGTSQRRSTIDTPEMTKHEDKALELGNPEKSKLQKGLQWLGLTE